MREYDQTERAALWLDGVEELSLPQKRKIADWAAEKGVCLPQETARYRAELAAFLPPNVLARLLKRAGDEGWTERRLAALEKKDVFFLSYRSKDYPPALREIPAAPFLLYGKGNAELLKSRCFSIVGSRKTAPWARDFAGKLACRLSEHFTVVTGLAEGGDVAAVSGVLRRNEEKIPLICVLAHGLDHVYPAVHAAILTEVFRRGLAISEYPPEELPQKYYFPVRNRIIAGMSVGVLVVSAGKRSGTSLTAGYALEFGRDVFALPYDAGTPSGEGCNRLIKQGAALVDCAEDILNAYGISAEPVSKNEPPMTEEEKKIVAFLTEQGDAHVEEIARAVGQPPYLLGGALSSLEVKGLIVRSGGNRYGVLR